MYLANLFWWLVSRYCRSGCVHDDIVTCVLTCMHLFSVLWMSHVPKGEWLLHGKVSAPSAPSLCCGVKRYDRLIVLIHRIVCVTWSLGVCMRVFSKFSCFDCPSFGFLSFLLPYVSRSIRMWYCLWDVWFFLVPVLHSFSFQVLYAYRNFSSRYLNRNLAFYIFPQTWAWWSTRSSQRAIFA